LRSAFGKLFALPFVWNLRISFKLNRFELSLSNPLIYTTFHSLIQPFAQIRLNRFEAMKEAKKLEIHLSCEKRLALMNSLLFLLSAHLTIVVDRQKNKPSSQASRKHSR